VDIDSAKPEQHGDDGYVVIRSVKVDTVVKFLRSYRFHDDAFDLDSSLLERYIKKQNEKGHLLEWNVAIVGGDSASDTERLQLATVSVKKIRRSKLRNGPADYADIKTLMSKEHRVIDLTSVSQTQARRMTEEALMHERKDNDPPLLAIYPIDRTSPPDEQNKASRVPLNAVEDVIGLGLVFPGSGAETAVEYMSADLSRLGLKPDEVERPEDEDPDEQDAGVA
jgi:hypothetical protein